MSGPRKLNAVGTPSSRRTPPACRKPGWNACAKQNVMPASSATAATRDGSSPRSTPSASSTSAEPDEDDAARLPCLTTRTPAAAHTIAAIVEMLTVCARSPPVPTTSRLTPGTVIRFAWASIWSAMPAHLLDGLALGPQRHEEPGDLGRRRRAGHDLVHRPLGRLGADVGAGDQRRQDVRPGMRHDGPVAAGAGVRPRSPCGDPGRPRRAPARSGRAGAARRGRPATRPPARRPGDGRSARGSAGSRTPRSSAAWPARARRSGDDSPSRTSTSNPPPSTSATTAAGVAHSSHDDTSTSRAGRRPTPRRTASRVALSSLKSRTRIDVTRAGRRAGRFGDVGRDGRAAVRVGHGADGSEGRPCPVLSHPSHRARGVAALSESLPP